MCADPPAGWETGRALRWCCWRTAPSPSWWPSPQQVGCGPTRSSWCPEAPGAAGRGRAWFSSTSPPTLSTTATECTVFLSTVKAYNVLNRRTCEKSSSPWRWKKAQADRSHSWCAQGGPACCGKLCGASLLSEPPPGWKARLLCAARPGEEGRNTSLLLHNNNRSHWHKGL